MKRFAMAACAAAVFFLAGACDLHAPCNYQLGDEGCDPVATDVTKDGDEGETVTADPVFEPDVALAVTPVFEPAKAIIEPVPAEPALEPIEPPTEVVPPTEAEPTETAPTEIVLEPMPEATPVDEAESPSEEITPTEATPSAEPTPEPAPAEPIEPVYPDVNRGFEWLTFIGDNYFAEFTLHDGGWTCVGWNCNTGGSAAVINEGKATGPGRFLQLRRYSHSQFEVGMHFLRLDHGATVGVSVYQTRGNPITHEWLYSMSVYVGANDTAPIGRAVWDPGLGVYRFYPNR